MIHYKYNQYNISYLKNLLQNAVDYIKPSSGIVRFINFNKNSWQDWKVSSPESEIIMDYYNVPQWIIAASYFVNILAKKNRAEIKVFARKYSDVIHMKRLKSFNCNQVIFTRIKGTMQRERVQKIINYAKSSIKTKKDLYNFIIDDVWVGISIYESYLRKGNYTVHIDDNNLWKIIEKAIEYYVFWSEYIQFNTVSAVVISHDSYIQYDILAKIAYKNNIPVYLPNSVGGNYSNEPHGIYKNKFYHYKDMFSKLTENEKRKALSLGEKQLKLRLSGEVGVDMPYSTKSAYVKKSVSTIIKTKNRMNILIAVHDFFDNPHCFGGMLFLDFYEWMYFLGELSNKTDYDWYVKAHPDVSAGSLEVVKMIVNKFPNFNLISNDASIHQLVNEGLNFVMTCYGSIGGEVPALGVPVINAGYNPRVNYDFNIHPKSIEQLEKLLLNLDNVKLEEVCMTQIYEFYYMHHYYTFKDDFLYPSWLEMTSTLSIREQSGSAAYDYFLSKHNDKRHFEIISKYNIFIDSGKVSYFSKGPE
jgi:hypothetical protein